MLGLILGLACGFSAFSPRLVRVLIFGYGLFLIPWILVAALTRSGPWAQRAMNVGYDIGIAAGQVMRSETVGNPVLFILVMAVLFWFIGVTSGFTLVRYANVWASIIPAGLAIIVISHYDPANTEQGRIISGYLFLALLLIGRVTYLRYRREWQINRVSQSSESGMELGRAILLTVVVLLLLTWTAPAIASSSTGARQFWQNLTDPWDSLRSRLSDTVASLRGTTATVSDFYGEDLKLGTGTSLGDGVVFNVLPERVLPTSVRNYWRARVYDHYLGGAYGWTSDFLETQAFKATDEELLYPAWLSRQKINFTFYSRVSFLETLYTGPFPLWVDKTGEALMIRSPDGTLDVGAVKVRIPLEAGDVYQVRSWISSPTAVQLRSSSVEYPQWIKDRYLQLPVTVTERLSALSRQITRGMDNPYDKAAAITQYLRDNISYSQDVPTPPPGVEPVEWFLFDLQQGYCNYYASAEVLMLRSLGIPARMAAGFAQGEYDAASNQYVVHQRDAHAWPEVYFEGYGWIEFEPTVSQPNRIIPSGNEAIDPNADQSLLDSRPDPLDPNQRFNELENVDVADAAAAAASQRRLLNYFLITAAVLGTGALLFFGWRYARRRLQLPVFPVFLERTVERGGFNPPAWLRAWAQPALLTPIQRAYGRLNQALRRVGEPAPPSATPGERALALGELLPPAETPALDLSNEYETGILFFCGRRCRQGAGCRG